MAPTQKAPRAEKSIAETLARDLQGSAAEKLAMFEMLRERVSVGSGAMPTKSKTQSVATPEATRPTVPGYSFAGKKNELLRWKWATDRLRKSRQYWIATTRPNGTPHLMIIWGVWFDEKFWFSTGASSRKARNLAVNPKCVIGTDDAAKAVILEGAVEHIDGDSTDLERFAKAYKKKYDWDVREMAQGIYRFRPNVGFGLYEKKFEQTATRWVFR